MFRLSRSVRFLGVGAHLVSLVCVAALVEAQVAEPETSRPIQIAFEVDAFWNGPEKESLREISRLHPLVLSWWLRELKSTAGINDEEVSRCTMTSQPLSGVVYSIETTAPMNSEQVRTALVPDGTEKKYGDDTYFEKADLAVYFPDHQTVVIGSPNNMPAVIDNYLAKKSTPEADAPTAKSSPPMMMLKFPPKSFRAGLPPQGPPPWLLTLFEAESVRAEFQPTDNKLTVELSVVFADPESAATGVPAMKEAVAQLDNYLKFAAASMRPGLKKLAEEHPRAEELASPFETAIQAARTGITNAKIEQADRKVTATISVDSKQPATDAVLLMSLVPREAK